MSGGGGGIIIIKNTITGLNDPIIHGQLPTHMLPVVDPILAKDPADWTARDRKEVAKAYTWALLNLQ